MRGRFRFPFLYTFCDQLRRETKQQGWTYAWIRVDTENTPQQVILTFGRVVVARPRDRVEQEIKGRARRRVVVKIKVDLLAVFRHVDV